MLHCTNVLAFSLGLLLLMMCIDVAGALVIKSIGDNANEILESEKPKGGFWAKNPKNILHVNNGGNGTANAEWKIDIPIHQSNQPKNGLKTEDISINTWANNHKNLHAKNGENAEWKIDIPDVPIPGIPVQQNGQSNNNGIQKGGFVPRRYQQMNNNKGKKSDSYFGWFQQNAQKHVWNPFVAHLVHPLMKAFSPSSESDNTETIYYSAFTRWSDLGESTKNSKSKNSRNNIIQQKQNGLSDSDNDSTKIANNKTKKSQKELEQKQEASEKRKSTKTSEEESDLFSINIEDSSSSSFKSSDENADETDEDKTDSPKIYMEFVEEDPKETERIFGQQRCHCGQHLLSEMRQWRLGDDWHFRVWPEPLGKGTTGAVYHAHAMAPLIGVDGKPTVINQCVAIKAVQLGGKATEGAEQEIRNELAVLKAFAERKAKRVIRLFASKDLPDEKRLFYVLELGTHDLNKEIVIVSFYKDADEDEFREIVQTELVNILQAVREMHKLIIHLDLKPGNMLYVREPNPTAARGWDPVLKVIDFGGSEFIPATETSIEMPKRANVCKVRAEMWYTELYSSPEQNSCEPYHVSTKSDIWAVGIMLLQMLFTRWFHLQNVNQQLADIQEYFQPQFGYEMPQETNDAMVLLHREFPTFFEIIMATLNPNPEERPTAHGLLAFLAGKCRLALTSDASLFLKENKLPPANLAKNLQNALVLPLCDMDSTETNSMEKRRK